MGLCMGITPVASEWRKKDWRVNVGVRAADEGERRCLFGVSVVIVVGEGGMRQ